MNILSKQISDLLFEHDCVIVPGLGGFITNYKPAVIHPHNHTFTPPSKQVSFNTALAGNDGVLISAYAKSMDISFSEAKKVIDQKVHTIRISLLKGEKIEIDGVGYLFANKENNIEFRPSGKVNFLNEAYGLPKFDFNPIERTTLTSVTSKPAVRQTMRWAAILVPVAAVALWATMNTSTLNRVYDNYASFFPSSQPVNVAKPAPVKESKKTKVVTAPVVKQDKQEAPAIEVATPVAEAGNKYYIIAGAFSIPENAERFVEQLKAQGYHASVIGQNRRHLHLVSIESYSDLQSANNSLDVLHAKGFPAAWLLEKTN